MRAPCNNTSVRLPGHRAVATNYKRAGHLIAGDRALKDCLWEASSTRLDPQPSLRDVFICLDQVEHGLRTARTLCFRQLLVRHLEPDCILNGMREVVPATFIFPALGVMAANLTPHFDIRAKEYNGPFPPVTLLVLVLALVFVLVLALGLVIIIALVLVRVLVLALVLRLEPALVLALVLVLILSTSTK